eukprot:3489148-Rhodomonas_salina.1
MEKAWGGRQVGEEELGAVLLQKEAPFLRLRALCMHRLALNRALLLPPHSHQPRNTSDQETTAAQPRAVDVSAEEAEAAEGGPGGAGSRKGMERRLEGLVAAAQARTLPSSSLLSLIHI